MSSVGIGILSFAHGHALAYCEAMRSMPDVRLAAAWDANPERGRPAAKKYGMAFEETADALLARDDLDAVIVTSETNRHADLIVKAAAAGKHILCQKPMATTLADCDRIIAAVDDSGVKFQMAFQMRCDPLNQQIKRWMDEGAIGRIGAIRRRHCINFLFNPELASGPSAWHIDPVANVGMFFDDAVHAADFLYWVMGAKPVSVMAEIDNVLTDIAPDDTGVAIYRFPGGAFGVLFNASVTLAAENTTEVYGDQGTIIQNNDDLVSTTMVAPGVAPLRIYRKGAPGWEEFPFELPEHHGKRLQAVPRPFIEMLLSGGEPTITARDGKVSVEMCLAAYESARDGRRVTLSEE